MRTIVFVISCAIVLTFAAPALAIFGLPQTLEGTVESVSDNMLVISRQEGNTQHITEFQINQETQFNQTASLEALEEGDTVKVRYKEDGDDKIAISIAKVMVEETTESSEQEAPESQQRL